MKKLISIMLCIIMLFGAVATVSAAGALSGAKDFVLGGTVNSSLISGSKVYKVNLPSAGILNIAYYSMASHTDIKVYDAQGNRLHYKSAYRNDNLGEIRYNDGISLCAGDYYVTLEASSSNVGSKFELTLTETPVYESFYENQGGSNNTTRTASYIYRGKEYVGCLALNDKTDIYKFDVAQSGCMNFDIYSRMGCIKVNLYDAEGNQVWYDYIYDNDTTQEIKFQEDFNLCQGIYYLAVSQYSGYGKFSFKLTYTPSFESFGETQTVRNDSTQTANLISMNTQYNGHFGFNDKVDVYKVYLNTSNPILQINAKLPCVVARLYDENGNHKWSKYIYDNDTTKEINFSGQMTSGYGTHYLSISQYDGYGNYSFNINDGGYVAPNYNTLGSVVNQALRTDITAKINGHDIPSYNVDGYTYICAEDLQYYGFSVVYDNDIRSLSLTRDYNQVWVSKAYTKPYVAPYEVGAHECYILLTDIATYFDGMFVNSYNINGQTIIRFDSLMAYGSMSYDDATRTMSLWLPGIN